MYLGPSCNVLKVGSQESRKYPVVLNHYRLPRWRRQVDCTGILGPFVTSRNGACSSTRAVHYQLVPLYFQAVECLINTFFEAAGIKLADSSLCSDQ
jgi:hypothetical protein